MKFILPLLSVSLILAACAPAPQVTVTPEATITSTPPPTETPLPTLTPTPVAVDGIAKDAEGNQLAYLNGEWTTLPPLGGEHAKLLQQPDGKVVAVDAEGEVVFEYDMAAHKWVEVEKEYNSCVDPELIAQQDADFMERTGIDLNVDMSSVDGDAKKFLEYINSLSGVGFVSAGKGMVNFEYVKTGYAEVMVNEGGVGKVMCVFGRNGVMKGETFSVVVGWEDASGKYHPLTFLRDSVTGQDLTIPWPKRGFTDIRGDDQLDAIRSMPDGAVLKQTIHTFDGVAGVDGISTDLTWTDENVKEVKNLLRRLGGDELIRRLGIDTNIARYWHDNDPVEGDMGFFPASVIGYINNALD